MPLGLAYAWLSLTGSIRAYHVPHERQISVAIGRALRPFPRSKRSVRLSPHSAFQLGQSTCQEQRSSCLPRDAPAKTSGHHLPFSVTLLAWISRGLPWRPSPCPDHYNQALGYYAASALCPACWYSRTPEGQGGVRVPQFRKEMLSQPVAAHSTPKVQRSNPDTA